MTKTEFIRQTYWSDNGKFQAEYDRLRAKLVPDEGKAETLRGELLRCLGNIYYDCYNNGGWNLEMKHFKKQIWTIGDAEEEITPFMKDPSNFRFILNKFEDDTWDNQIWEMEALEDLANAVIQYVNKKEASA